MVRGTVRGKGQGERWKGKGAREVKGSGIYRGWGREGRRRAWRGERVSGMKIIF